MPRTLQHITWQAKAKKAGEEGRKVETLCGARVYQMPNMSPEIPTCTPCSRVLMEEYAKPLPVTYTITTSGATWSSGGVA